MTGSPPMPDVVVVGAGLSGLLAAKTLRAAGADVIMVDKAGGPGGRLATRRIAAGSQTGVFDHGAQFFTVRSDAFARVMADWPVRVWHHGPATAAAVDKDPSSAHDGGDGHPRYVGSEGMNGIAKHLADGLDVRVRHRVRRIREVGEGWQVDTADEAASLSASSVLITCPVPQAAALVANVQMPDLTYHPCIAVLAVLDNNPVRPAVQFGDGPVHYLADNADKGISDVPAVTVHASGPWSVAHYDDDDSAISKTLLDLVRPWLDGAGVLTTQVKRWRYSQPADPHQDPAVTVATGLVLAGDSFGQAKIEGAALSGLAAADLLG